MTQSYIEILTFLKFGTVERLETLHKNIVQIKYLKRLFSFYLWFLVLSNLNCHQVSHTVCKNALQLTQWPWYWSQINWAKQATSSFNKVWLLHFISEHMALASGSQRTTLVVWCQVELNSPEHRRSRLRLQASNQAWRRSPGIELNKDKWA